MKTVLFSLILCLLLTACGEKPLEVPPPEPPPVIAEAPEPEPEPVLPIPPKPEPLPVYLFENKAFDSRGKLLFTCDRGQLSLPYGKPTRPVLQVRQWAGEQEWYDFYDENGQPLLSGFPKGLFWAGPRFCNDLLVCCTGEFFGKDNAAHFLMDVYAFPSGTLLYDQAVDVTALSPDRAFLTFRDGRSSLLLGRDGVVLKEYPPQATALRLTDDYWSLRQDGRCTLLNAKGEPVLDRDFSRIHSIQSGCAVVGADGDEAVDLATGETVLTGLGTIRLLLPDFLAVAREEGDGFYQLLRYDGTPLSDKQLSSVSEVDKDGDGTIDLLLGTYPGDGDSPKSQTVCFDAQGKELWTMEARNMETSLGLGMRNPTKNGVTTCTLIDLETGASRVPGIPGVGSFARPWGVDETPYYIEVSQHNPQGHTWTAYYAPDGLCLAERLLDAAYQGGGVVSCRRGFTQGLLSLETGQWLYAESIFSALDDEGPFHDW